MSRDRDRDRQPTTLIDLPDPSLVVLVGPSGSGKSSFARRHFAPTEVIASDACRGLVADDENDQAATADAFAVLQFIAARRLAQPRFTVIDATNVQRESRRPLVELARRHDLLPVAIVLDLPEAVCQARNQERADRSFGPHVIRQQRSQLHKAIKGLQREGFRRVFVLRSEEEVEAVQVTRSPLCPIAAPSKARSTSSATSTAATPSSFSSSASSATSSRRTASRRRRPRVAERPSWATSSTVAPRARRC